MTTETNAPQTVSPTPGPWIIDPTYPCYVNSAFNGRPICTVNSGINEEDLANARLITMAPQLLAELAGCVGVLAAIGISFEAQLSTSAIEGLAEVVQRCKDVLDKATKYTPPVNGEGIGPGEG